MIKNTHLHNGQNQLPQKIHAILSSQPTQPFDCYVFVCPSDAWIHLCFFVQIGGMATRRPEKIEILQLPKSVIGRVIGKVGSFAFFLPCDLKLGRRHFRWMPWNQAGATIKDIRERTGRCSCIQIIQLHFWLRFAVKFFRCQVLSPKSECTCCRRSDRCSRPD